MQLISTRKTSGRSYQVWATLNMPEHTQLKVTPAKLSFEKKKNKKDNLLILMIKELHYMIGMMLTFVFIWCLNCLSYWWSKNQAIWLVWSWQRCLYWCDDDEWWWSVFVVWLTWRKAFSLISSQDHCQRSSPSRISDTPRAGFEPAQNLTSALVE